jgi:hypothetical protein
MAARLSAPRTGRTSFPRNNIFLMAPILISVRRKISQLVFLLQRLGWSVRREVSNDSVMRTGEWSEESSKQDIASTFGDTVVYQVG